MIAFVPPDSEVLDAMSAYPALLDRMARYRPVSFNEIWPDYAAEFGLGPEHVPDMVRMATDQEVFGSDDDLKRAASTHALRALGQLRAVEAVPALLDAIGPLADCHDFWKVQLSHVLTVMGPGAIPELTRGLAATRLDEVTRIACAQALSEIARADPDVRDICVTILLEQLARREDTDTIFVVNAFIIAYLLNLNAVESAPAIEAAFKAGLVDETIIGDWPGVKYDLGLGPEPESRKRTRVKMRDLEVGSSRRPDPRKLLRKQKLARKAARKRNRK